MQRGELLSKFNSNESCAEAGSSQICLLSEKAPALACQSCAVMALPSASRMPSHQSSSSSEVPPATGTGSLGSGNSSSKSSASALLLATV